MVRCGRNRGLREAGQAPVVAATPSRRRDPGRRLDDTLDFLRVLWTIEHRLQSASKRMEAALGITGPQRLVLRIVSQFPDLSATELAEIVHLHPSTITGIVQRLIRKGLLSRERDPSDRRRVRLRVRARGKRFTAATSGTVESAVERVLARAPVQHVRRTREVLWTIAAALEGTAAGPPRRATRPR